MIGLGEALHRLDDDDQALGQWEAATQLPENEHTYAAWRNVAAARVRAGDLRGALNAYREADRRAPRSDKAEIASRMGWLSKELGDGRASGPVLRAGPRRRGVLGRDRRHRRDRDRVAARELPPGRASRRLPRSPSSTCTRSSSSTRSLLAAGELYRLWTRHPRPRPAPARCRSTCSSTCTLLYLAGPIVERLYGRWPFLAHLPRGRRGRVARRRSRSVTRPISGVAGASGAIFGMFGLLIAAELVHRPVLDRQTRGVHGPARRARDPQPDPRLRDRSASSTTGRTSAAS